MIEIDFSEYWKKGFLSEFNQEIEFNQEDQTNEVKVYEIKKFFRKLHF